MLKRISILIPCYNSEKTLEDVVAKILSVFKAQTQWEYQIILVNDGSTDKTLNVIRALCTTNNKIVGVNLSKNHGQARAKMAGLPFVTGNILVYMDDDGQHPPEEILQLAQKVEEGWDVVFAAFTKKKHSFFKVVTSKIHAWILTKTIKKPKTLKLSSFFAVNAFVVKQLQNYHSPFPAQVGFLLQITNSVTNIPMSHYPRQQGESGYTLAKLVSLWLNGFTGFSIVPLRAASLIGTLFACVGFLSGAYIVVHKLLNPQIAAGYTSLMAVFLFLGGVIMLMIGLLGEYIGRTFMVLSDMPQYTIREVFGDKEQKREQ